MDLGTPAAHRRQAKRNWFVSVGLLGIVPAAFAVQLIIVAATTRGFAGDFRMELYPEAQKVMHGINPFPPASPPFEYYNLIWPIPAAVALSPLTLLPVPAAIAVFTCLGGAALAAALWLLGVRDWRVYGVVALWPATLSGIQAGNVTPLLALLLAVAWRCRERRIVPGVALGAAVALKMFLWPMGLWLLATRRFAAAAAAGVGALLVPASVLPFTSLGEYARLLSNIGKWSAPWGFGLFGLLSQAGFSWHATLVIGYSLGAAILLVAWRRRSFVLALAGAILISPLVWLHYFTLLVVPLALRSKTLDWLWLLPLVMWCCTRSTQGSVTWQTVVALACLAITVVAAERPRSGRPLAAPAPAAA